MANILVFGDSIAAGAWDIEGGWVARLKKHFFKRILDTKLSEYHEIHNLGIPGDISSDIVVRFENETNARKWEDLETIIIFEFGINDSAMIVNTNSNWVDKKIFYEDLQILVTKAKKYTENIIVLGLTPIDELQVNPIPWDTKKAYIKSEIKKYDLILNNFCGENNIIYIELYNKLNKADLTDGVHPNTTGHQIIFYEVLKVIEKII